MSVGTHVAVDLHRGVEHARQQHEPDQLADARFEQPGGRHSEEHHGRRVAIYSLGDHHRGLLYRAAAAVVFLAVSATRLFETGVGELVWFVLLAGVFYAAMEIYRHVRSY